MKLLQEFKFSLRILLKSPSFALTSLLVIVMGMTLYVCSYSLGYNFGAKPLPYEDGNRFVAVRSIYAETGTGVFGQTFDEYAANYLLARIKGFSDFVVYRYINATLSDGEHAERFVGAVILPGGLQMTGVKPLLGRLFEDADASPGAQAVAIISHSTWQNYYGGNGDIIGSTSRINGGLYQIVGVMPAGFDYPASQHIWLPLDLSQGVKPSGDFSLAGMGVLKAGVAMAEAERELNQLLAALKSEYPEHYGRWRELAVVPHSAALTGNTGATDLLQLLNTVILGLVALNLGTLLFVRALSREKELALRAALGANRWAVARQILMESLALCLAGWLVSLAFAGLMLRGLENEFVANAAQSDTPGTLPSWIHLGIDARALLVTLAVTLTIWLLSGLWIALRATRANACEVLSSGGKGSSGSGRSVLTRFIVGTEVTVSSFLLIACALITTAILSLYRLDYGTATQNYITGFFELNAEAYSGADQRREFLTSFSQELEQQSKFEGVTLTSALPGQFGANVSYNIEDRDLLRDKNYPTQTLVAVDDDFFDVLEVTISQGRSFDSSDVPGSSPVAIIDELLANRLWPKQSAVGKRLQVNAGKDNAEWLTIIGVSSHVIHGNPFGGYDKRPSMYRPLSQYTPAQFSFAVRMQAGMPFSTARELIADTMTSIDRDTAIMSFRSLERVISMSTSSSDILARAATAYGLTTLVFAVIGIYGLIVRSVVLRSNEIGVRKALGSSSEGVLWLFLRQGFVYLLVGTLVGGSAALLASSALTSYFTNLMDFVVPVVVGVMTIMAALVLLASYLPARKLTRMEAGDVLHYE